MKQFYNLNLKFSINCYLEKHISTKISIKEAFKQNNNVTFFIDSEEVYFKCFLFNITVDDAVERMVNCSLYPIYKIVR